jgi:hypothetical protein
MNVDAFDFKKGRETVSGKLSGCDGMEGKGDNVVSNEAVFPFLGHGCSISDDCKKIAGGFMTVVVDEILRGCSASDAVIAYC